MEETKAVFIGALTSLFVYLLLDYLKSVKQRNSCIRTLRAEIVLNLRILQVQLSYKIEDYPIDSVINVLLRLYKKLHTNIYDAVIKTISIMEDDIIERIIESYLKLQDNKNVLLELEQLGLKNQSVTRKEIVCKRCIEALVEQSNLLKIIIEKDQNYIFNNKIDETRLWSIDIENKSSKELINFTNFTRTKEYRSRKYDDSMDI